MSTTETLLANLSEKGCFRDQKRRLCCEVFVITRGNRTIFTMVYRSAAMIAFVRRGPTVSKRYYDAAFEVALKAIRSFLDDANRKKVADKSVVPIVHSRRATSSECIRTQSEVPRKPDRRAGETSRDWDL